MDTPGATNSASVGAAPTGGAAPSDAEIARERKRATAKANLDKGRAVLKAQRAEEKDDAPTEKVNPVTLHAGCRALVRFCYVLAAFGAWVSGGKLADLSDNEIDEGAKEAAALVSRFVWLARLLAFVGFPLWLARTVAVKFEKKAPEQKPAASPLSMVPRTATPGAAP